jgi:acylphosphatase
VERNKVQIFYSGNVQGVGFRYSVRQVATGFEVTGSIRNLPDGRVEMIAEGAKDELKVFLEAIRDSGMGHFIRDEKATWSAPTGEFRGFQIAG